MKAMLSLSYPEEFVIFRVVSFPTFPIKSRRGSMLWLFCGKIMLVTLGYPGFYFYYGWSYILFVLHFKDLEAVFSIEFVVATIRSVCGMLVFNSNSFRLN